MGTTEVPPYQKSWHMILNRKFLSTFLVCISMSWTHPAPASSWLQGPSRFLNNIEQAPERLQNAFSNKACFANNCMTIEGLINCLKSDPNFSAHMTPTQFFQRNAQGLPIQRTVRIPTALEPVDSPDHDHQNMSSAKIVTVESVVSLIRSSTYKAFQNVAQQNQNCLKTFCNRNCLYIDIIHPEYVDRYTRTLKNAIVTIQVKGKKYSVSQLRHMDDDERRGLAKIILIDAFNSVITGQCLAGNQTASIIRMLCAQCTKTLRDTVAKTNIACTSFDPKTEVALTIMEKDDDALYQRELQEVQKKQAAVIATALPNNQNPAASVDLHRLVSNLNKAVNSGVTQTTLRQTQGQFNQLITANPGAQRLNVLNPAFGAANTAIDRSKGLVSRANGLYNRNYSEPDEDADEDSDDPRDIR